MKDSCYLVFTAKGLRRMVKGGQTGYPRRQPTLQRGEYAVRVSVVVPDKAFRQPPIAEAVITVPEEAVVVGPPEVDVTVTDPSTVATEAKPPSSDALDNSNPARAALSGTQGDQ